jgi:predicted enzyme related to lactoylglutathione lyase
MSKANAVHAVYYSVKDVPRSIKFYRELLDIADTSWEGEHGAEFILRDGTAFGVGKYSSGDWEPSGCVMFGVDDVEAAAKRVPQIGGTLVEELRTFPNCRAQWCEDPDGNSFVLHQRTK